MIKVTNITTKIWNIIKRLFFSSKDKHVIEIELDELEVSEFYLDKSLFDFGYASLLERIYEDMNKEKKQLKFTGFCASCSSVVINNKFDFREFGKSEGSNPLMSLIEQYKYNDHKRFFEDFLGIGEVNVNGVAQHGFYLPRPL